jgi:hypothetical protein
MKTIYENNSVQSVQVREIFGIGADHGFWKLVKTSLLKKPF